MKFLLISTHQWGGRNVADLLNLFGSVTQARSEGADVSLYCLLQKTTAVPVDLRPAVTEGINLPTHAEGMGLSRVRNLVLQAVDLAAFDVVLFPDDDCSYQVGFFPFLTSLIDRQKPDLLFIRNNSLPASLPAVSRVPRASLMDTHRRVNSRNIIAASAIAAAIGRFDERLGLGTSMGGGEDNALRALDIASNALFVDDHQPQAAQSTISRRVSKKWRDIGRGVMLQTLEHLRPEILPLAGYRTLSGIYLLLTRRLPILSFFAPYMWVAGSRRRSSGDTAGRQKS